MNMKVKTPGKNRVFVQSALPLTVAEGQKALRRFASTGVWIRRAPSAPRGHPGLGKGAAGRAPPALVSLRLQKSPQVGCAGREGRCRCFFGIVRYVDQQNRKWQRAETVCVISSL